MHLGDTQVSETPGEREEGGRIYLFFVVVVVNIKTSNQTKNGPKKHSEIDEKRHFHENKNKYH